MENEGKKYHVSVLLKEVLAYLQIENGKKYIDGTLGGGGHTGAIVEKGGIVLGIDVDEDALNFVKLRIAKHELKEKERLVLARGNFKDIGRLAKEYGFEKVSGVLLDLGVSSFQLDKAEKGFSFLQDGPLDMRMDSTLAVRAADLVMGMGRGELEYVFKTFGEDRNAKKIAQTIIIERQFKKIETTQDLVRVIEKAYGVTNEVLSDKRKAEIATRVFQALRIAVNAELGVLEDVLPSAWELLEPGGRLVIITFHSLEDRIVKHTFLDMEKKNMGKVITKKPIEATPEEVQENRRSRSAKLRVFEKN